MRLASQNQSQRFGDGKKFVEEDYKDKVLLYRWTP